MSSGPINENAGQPCDQGRITIGMPAPDFKAKTTHGNIRLSDYKGRWLIFFSHPADFTPVCTTEFISFAKHYDEFKKRGVELLGLTVDSLFAHIAWVRNIEEKTGVKIPFPVIADLDTNVSRLYGVIHPHVSLIAPVRALFVIGPDQRVKMCFFYPKGVGRNIEEVLRIIDALQLVEKEDVATPANWKPGDAVLMKPPKTQRDADKRMKEGYDCVDWYYCTKKL